MSYTILIVDDDDAIRKGLTDLLADQDKLILTAENGQVAVDLVESHQDTVSLVILDIAMPIMDGIEAFARIRNIREDIPIIILSGQTDAKRHPDLDFTDKNLLAINKPFDPIGLITQVEQLL